MIEMERAPEEQQARSARIDQLLALADPYGPITPDDDAVFQDAMAACDAHHRARNPRYAQLWDGDERPMIPVGLFKRIDLATPVDDDGVWLTSSGTGSGTATRVFFDRTSMDRIKRGMMQIFLRARFIDFAPARFLLLSPDPASGNHPGYATTFDKFTGCAPVRERVFAVDAAGRFRPEIALEALRRWAGDPAPIFLFGLTVHFEQLATCTEEPIVQRGTIRGLTGGGWKGIAKQLGRDEIVARLAALLQPPSLDVRDLFGLTEHPLHYISCARGRFHLPKYARVQIVDATGAAAPPGEPGLIRLSSPLFASLPSHDLLTEDRGAWGERCDCGEPLPYLAYLDRVTASTGTCARVASERAGS
jgi:Acyl-protein synthetase, LuxE